MHLDVLSLAQGWMALPGAQDMLLNLCAPVSLPTWWGGHVSAVLSGLDEFRAQCSTQPPGAEYGYEALGSVVPVGIWHLGWRPPHLALSYTVHAPGCRAVVCSWLVLAGVG